MLARSKSVANPEFQPTFNFLLDCGLYEPFAVYAHVKQKKRLEHKILGMSTVLNSGVTNVKQREQLPREQQARGAHRPNQKYF